MVKLVSISYSNVLLVSSNAICHLLLEASLYCSSACSVSWPVLISHQFTRSFITAPSLWFDYLFILVLIGLVECPFLVSLFFVVFYNIYFYCTFEFDRPYLFFDFMFLVCFVIIIESSTPFSILLQLNKNPWSVNKLCSLVTTTSTVPFLGMKVN